MLTPSSVRKELQEIKAQRRQEEAAKPAQEKEQDQPKKAAARPAQPSQDFDVKAWTEGKQAHRKSLYDLADRTALSAVQDGEKFREYLDVQAGFGRYSATNALLILAQMPQAIRLRDFDRGA